MSSVWVFGYGSLIWRPDFAFVRRERASLAGYARRFWQGSHDHRGVPDAPGRVVTLVPESAATCDGIAYLIDAAIVASTFEALDHREKNGYERLDVQLQLSDGVQVPGLVYVAARDNFAWLGDAPLTQIARQIARSEGPSGRNVDYLLELADALSDMNIRDDHVQALATRVRALGSAVQST